MWEQLVRAGVLGKFSDQPLTVGGCVTGNDEYIELRGFSWLSFTGNGIGTGGVLMNRVSEGTFAESFDGPVGKYS